MISATSKIWSKPGPVDLLTITKMAQKMEEKYGIILAKYDLCQCETQEIENLRGNVCPRYQIVFECFRCCFDLFLCFFVEM